MSLLYITLSLIGMSGFIFVTVYLAGKLIVEPAHRSAARDLADNFPVTEFRNEIRGLANELIESVRQLKPDAAPAEPRGQSGAVRLDSVTPENAQDRLTEIRAMIRASDVPRESVVADLKTLMEKTTGLTNVEAMAELGATLIALREYGDAAVYLMEAKKANVEDAELRRHLSHNLGIALYHLGTEDAPKLYLAQASLREAIDMGSQLPQTYLFAGLAHWRLGQHDDALEVTQKCIGLATTRGEIQWELKGKNNVAYYLYELAVRKYAGRDKLKPDGDTATALDLIEEVIKKTSVPTPQHFDTRGCIRMWAGQHSAALEDFLHAMGLTTMKGRVSRLHAEHYTWAQSRVDMPEAVTR